MEELVAFDERCVVGMLSFLSRASVLLKDFGSDAEQVTMRLRKSLDQRALDLGSEGEISVGVHRRRKNSWPRSATTKESAAKDWPTPERHATAKSAKSRVTTWLSRDRTRLRGDGGSRR